MNPTHRVAFVCAEAGWRYVRDLCVETCSAVQRHAASFSRHVKRTPSIAGTHRFRPETAPAETAYKFPFSCSPVSANIGVLAHY